MVVQNEVYMVDPKSYIHTALAVVLRYRTLCTALTRMYEHEYEHRTWPMQRTQTDVERMLSCIQRLACVVSIDMNDKKQQIVQMLGFATLAGPYVYIRLCVYV